MSDIAKVLLVVLLLGVLGIGACVGAAVFWVSRNKDALLAQGKEAMSQGQALGKTLDQRGCVERVAGQSASCDGIMCEVRQGLVLGGCLETARKTPGFCDGVPPESSIMATVKWRLRTCADLADSDKERCGRLLAAWQKHCEKKPR